MSLRRFRALRQIRVRVRSSRGRVRVKVRASDWDKVMAPGRHRVRVRRGWSWIIDGCSLLIVTNFPLSSRLVMNNGYGYVACLKVFAWMDMWI